MNKSKINQTIKFNRIINKLINISLLLLLLLSLFFSLQSDILFPDKLSDSFFLLFPLFFFMAILLLYFIKLITIQKILIFIKSNSKKIFWGIFALTALYQMILFAIFDTMPRYDSLTLLTRMKDPQSISEYLSLYPNNSFFFFTNYFFSRFLGYSFKVYELINIILINSSVIFLKLACEHFFQSKRIGYISGLSLLFYAGFQPLFLVPYTDTYSLFSLTLALLFISLALESPKKRSTFIFLAALSSGVTYLLRPSAIIYIIAAFFFLIFKFRTLFLEKEVSQRKTSIFSISLFLIVYLLTIFSFNSYLSHQKLVKINPDASMPLSHFLLIGSFGNADQKDSHIASYNGEDVNLSLSKTSRAERQKATMEAFIKRTRKRGFAKSIKFYLQKYSKIMDAGVVGYHREGLPFFERKPSRNALIHNIRQTYLQDGKFRPSFNFFCQIVWIISLLLAIYGLWNYKEDWRVAIVSLTIIGGLLFLEIFESGGSRYFLQYMPFFNLLTAIGFKGFFEKIK